MILTFFHFQHTLSLFLSLIRVKNTFMEMFIKRFSRKFFFCNENKTKAFLENCEHIFLDVEKTLENEISDKPQVI